MRLMLFPKSRTLKNRAAHVRTISIVYDKYVSPSMYQASRTSLQFCYLRFSNSNCNEHKYFIRRAKRLIKIVSTRLAQTCQKQS